MRRSMEKIERMKIGLTLGGTYCVARMFENFKPSMLKRKKKALSFRMKNVAVSVFRTVTTIIAIVI
jgi:hypothetical protein